MNRAHVIHEHDGALGARFEFRVRVGTGKQAYALARLRGHAAITLTFLLGVTSFTLILTLFLQIGLGFTGLFNTSIHVGASIGVAVIGVIFFGLLGTQSGPVASAVARNSAAP